QHARPVDGAGDGQADRGITRQPATAYRSNAICHNAILNIRTTSERPMRLVTILALVILAPNSPAQSPAKYAPKAEELRAAYQRPAQFRPDGRAYKLTLAPHWFGFNSRFWYRNDLKNGTKEFVAVDAEKGTRGPAFDHAKLAATLSKAAGKDYSA